MSEEQFADLYRRAQVLQPLVHWFRLTGQALAAGATDFPAAALRFLGEEFDRWDENVAGLGMAGMAASRGGNG